MTLDATDPAQVGPVLAEVERRGWKYSLHATGTGYGWEVRAEGRSRMGAHKTISEAIAAMLEAAR